MKHLNGVEAETANKFFAEAGRVATDASCLKARCGTVIVAKNGDIIGQGFNGPPLGQESNRTCGHYYDRSRKPNFDLTCCIHAEWSAILDATKHHPEQIPGSRLYFMRVDKNGNLTTAGDPYCTVCSRLALESGIAEFALLQDRGPAIWPTDEYNRDSYAYFEAGPDHHS